MTFFLLLTEAAIRLTFLLSHVNRIFLLSLPAIRKKGISIKTQKETGCKQPISGLILRSVNFYFTDESEPSLVIFARSVFILPTSQNRHSSSFSEGTEYLFKVIILHVPIINKKKLLSYKCKIVICICRKCIMSQWIISINDTKRVSLIININRNSVIV